MKETGRPFSVGIVDYSTRRMTEEEAAIRNIPQEIRSHIAELRQYPLKISDFLPEGTLWFDKNRPWYFRSILSSYEKAKELEINDVLIMSGSGMSAYKYQEGAISAFDIPEDKNCLDRSEQLIKNVLGDGKWVLGICFGGQLAMHSLGGRLGRLPNNAHGHAVTEAGYLVHELTPEGEKDEVFGHLPEKFYAAHFHNDFVDTLPQAGSKVTTDHGNIEVVRSEILAVRHGYLDRDGLKNKDKAYIHGSVVEFDNGARAYHIQPHPEMSTPKRANFFTRHVGWWLEQEEEMGKEYAKKATEISKDAEYSAANIITHFVEAYKQKLGKDYIKAVLPAVIAELSRHRIE